jgi:predicted GIY-YIG superfamily endonuclease
MSVYLIHFDKKYWHAQHYIGYADDVYQRIHRHETGNGARLMEVITQAGIGWSVVRVWWGADRAFERKLKNRKNARFLCPICRQEAQLGLPWFNSPEVTISWGEIQPIAHGGETHDSQIVLS